MANIEPIKVPLGTSDWRRSLADEPDILVRNRYFEQNPTNLEEQAALISRPGLFKYKEVGSGPIRQVYSQPGSFDDDLFAMSNDTLYRVSTADNSVETIGPGYFPLVTSTPSMVATANIEAVPEYLYIAEGGVLWLYLENGFAQNRLQVTGTIVNTDTISIAGVYYRWTNASVDAGSPAGTSGNPWLVALGSSNADAMDNMAKAVNDTGVAGTTYSTALTKNPSAQVGRYTSSDLVANALAYGTGGNLLAVTETGAGMAWDSVNFTGGGSPSITQVVVPDDVGVISVGYVASYVIVVIAQGYDVNGRFYWIEPGETTIDPLNFATAERSPDPVHSVRVVGDQFWLLGTDSTEVWYATGNQDTPFQRVQGRLFDRGVWQGTDVQIKDFVLLVDPDGIVYRIGSSPERISNNSIEERIRTSITNQIRSVV